MLATVVRLLVDASPPWMVRAHSHSLALSDSHYPLGSVRYQAIELTRDHQIDTNESERQRLLKEHPNELDVVYHDRVKGRLQPTRGLGTRFSLVAWQAINSNHSRS